MLNRATTMRYHDSGAYQNVTIWPGMVTARRTRSAEREPRDGADRRLRGCSSPISAVSSRLSRRLPFATYLMDHGEVIAQ